MNRLIHCLTQQSRNLQLERGSADDCDHSNCKVQLMGQTEKGDSTDQLWERRRYPGGLLDVVNVHVTNVRKKRLELLLS